MWRVRTAGKERTFQTREEALADRDYVMGNMARDAGDLEQAAELFSSAYEQTRKIFGDYDKPHGECALGFVEYISGL